MNKLTVLLITLLIVATVEAQSGKDARIKEIRTAYAQAKKKIEQNGKGGKSPKDMTIVFNQLEDEDIPLYTEESINYYFDETYPEGVAVKHPYFIVVNWTCHGHIKYREILLNPQNQQVMFCYMKGETDSGFVIESRYYYDTKGKCIEEKHNTQNSWTDGGSEKGNAEYYLKLFTMVNSNGYLTPLDTDKKAKPTTPKAKRIAQIRAIYAQAKDKIAKNEKAEMPNDLHITIHDLGDDQPPRTKEINMYFDTACYFISEHSSSMSMDSYGEYLFDPQGESLIFSYTRGREEGCEYEWRYYYDENGKCIETKSNSEDTDDGFYDKRAAKDFQAIFNTLLNESQE
ncbi:MAG: hypothetical protein IKR05_09225 [Prevotella sp.]|nr:hypothetical protein [Prevotella sp.]